MTDKFHVGQRVRIINGRVGARVGKLATIVSPRILGIGVVDRKVFNAYELDVDGEGRLGIHGVKIGYPEEWLEPIPDDEAFKRFMSHTLEPLKETA